MSDVVESSLYGDAFVPIPPACGEALWVREDGNGRHGRSVTVLPCYRPIKHCRRYGELPLRGRNAVDYLEHVTALLVFGVAVSWSIVGVAVVDAAAGGSGRRVEQLLSDELEQKSSTPSPFFWPFNVVLFLVPYLSVGILLFL